MEEEEEFTLTWGDTSGEVVQTEEVICDMPPEMLSEETDEFPAAVAQNGGGVQEENIMYLTADNVLVMPQTADDAYMECQEVTEEVVAETWEENCPEEIIVGSEEAVVSGQAVEEDIEVPLPTDQDEYTAARPYPCDFCSRRFRKKANLMNHMVAHQTDRPHGCNLCGVRYIRKCDLMNHLKSHAYIPDGDTFDDDDLTLDEGDDDKSRKKQKAALKKRRKQKIKEEFDTFESDDVASSSRSYNYANEDIKLMEVMDNNGQNEYTEYLEETHGITEQRFPITDAKKPFVCQHCGVSFAREKALASHSRIHGGDSPFECQKCGEMFWDADSVRDHMRAKHGGDIENFDEDLSEDDNKYGTYYCATCGLSFHRQDNLKRHQKVHVKDEMKNDDYSTEREEEYGHICNVCGESFPEALDLLAHAEVHARTTEHRCMMCGEVCEDEQSVAAHVQSVHGEELTPNTCMLCGRVCKDRRTLLKHSWEHTKEKMFECSKCDKTFHNKARLKRHMFSHRNKIVTCEECGDEFPDGRSLMNHRHSHSSVSGRQFPCRECGKTFGSRSSQQIHIRIHTGERPYGCRFCWKAFADGGTLRKHERIHTGEKPYACAVCPRAFNQRVVLREHIRSHHSGPDPNHTHSVTPYCCSVCSDMFSTSQDLIVHLIHHCDMNTAMKRQPQIGPRKYKRRRKLKPHELDLISKCQDDEMEQEQFTESDTEERAAQPQRKVRKTKKSPPKTPPTFSDLYNTCSSTIENIRIMVDTGKTPPKKDKNKKAKPETPPVALPSRPKMIHTQKTRVAVEATEDGKVRHKTKTLVTRTQPTELKSATGERIRPRTKNVNYHVFSSDKLPLATFPDDAEAAVNNLLKEQDLETDAADASEILLDNGNEEEIGTPEVAQEQTVETEEPTITNFIKVDRRSSRRLNNSQNSLKPGRTIIGPGSKVVRLVKGGMIVSKKKSTEPQTEPENIFPDDPLIKIKEEFIKQEVVDASPLHELAEISMQHAQNLFKCEMCSEVFTDRAQLLVHVPIHI